MTHLYKSLNCRNLLRYSVTCSSVASFRCLLSVASTTPEWMSNRYELSIPDVWFLWAFAFCDQEFTDLGKVKEQALHGWQHFHHPLYDFTPSVSESYIVYTRHFKSSLAHQMICDTLSHRLIWEIGIWVEGLKGMIREIFEILLNRPLDFGVILWSSAKSTERLTSSIILG